MSEYKKFEKEFGRYEAKNICPICLNQATNVSSKDKPYPSDLIVDCGQCNPENLERFYVTWEVRERIYNLDSNQREVVSNNLRNNVFNKQRNVIIDTNNIDDYLKK